MESIDKELVPLEKHLQRSWVSGKDSQMERLLLLKLSGESPIVKCELACPQLVVRVTCVAPESSVMVHCSSGGPEMLCRFLFSSGDSPRSAKSLRDKPINDLALFLEKRRTSLASALT